MRRPRDEEMVTEPSPRTVRRRGENTKSPGDSAPKSEELVFEDPFGDEFEEEDVADEVSMEDDQVPQEVEMETEEQPAKKVWQPGSKLGEGEVLEFDPSAYDMLHSLDVQWSCLTFDIIRDTSGYLRKKFPHSMYLVTGTQAGKSWQNAIYILKVSQLGRIDNDDREIDDDEANEVDDDPMVESQMVQHRGGVNRIRSLPSHPAITASWSDSGFVHIWNFSSQLKALNLNAAQIPNANYGGNKKPIQNFSGHASEGYALDWSPTVEGRLLTGDCASSIYLWDYNKTHWDVGSTSFTAHTASVEDIQWSPKEANVFASCSADKTIKLWDTRMKSKPARSVLAHKSDVNVISWNKQTDFLLVSGSDDGSFTVWDLRNFKPGSHIAHMNWHKGPITSVEWNPTEAPMLVVSGEDNQITTWDMSLEKEAQDSNTKVDIDFEVPDQLLFSHMGQTQIKEVHWHPQIPGAIVSTAFDGFNIYKSYNV
eukprot:TRINITY_DN9974_c0_g1_i2.p1 TRINITY_DN9974_c0_g1~~TRINITY_DN9974_c0_g1_i2.p1  ORF type:complete len:491 (+),score=80.30 TRINITY_DN9974_c0_g1_i2:31-1473(+)